jgi:hypothetical protein
MTSRVIKVVKVLAVMCVMLFGLFFGIILGNSLGGLLIWPVSDPIGYGPRTDGFLVCQWLGLAISTIGSVWVSVTIWRSDR